MKSQKDLIYEACEAKGISVSRMCQDLNINYGTFRIAITQRKLSADMVLKTCKYLDIDALTLLEAPVYNKKKGPNENS